MRVSLRELAQSIGTLADLDLDGDAESALRRSVEAARALLDADTAGLMITDRDGQLFWVVAADARAQTAESVQQRLALGPCVTAFEEARPVAVWDVAADDRWAPIRDQLGAAEIGSALSVPVTLGGGPIGVLDLYCAGPRLWDDSHIATAQAYAGVLGLLLSSALSAAAAGELAEQLQHALTARIQIEQAKGVLMARDGLGERAAWERLRSTARSTRRPVSAIARELLAELEPATAEPEQAS